VSFHQATINFPVLFNFQSFDLVESDLSVWDQWRGIHRSKLINWEDFNSRI
jgi:hypothetical protein